MSQKFGRFLLIILSFAKITKFLSKSKVPKCYLWSVILNSSQAPRTSTGSCKCLSSWCTQCFQLSPASEFRCTKLMIFVNLLEARWSILIPCRTLLMFIVLLTLKARLGGLLVRFSDGLCWPLNRMLCTSRFNVVWQSVDCVRETLYIYIWQNLRKWVFEFSPHGALNSTDHHKQHNAFFSLP